MTVFVLCSRPDICVSMKIWIHIWTRCCMLINNRRSSHLRMEWFVLVSHKISTEGLLMENVQIVRIQLLLRSKEIILFPQLLPNKFDRFCIACNFVNLNSCHTHLNIISFFLLHHTQVISFDPFNCCLWYFFFFYWSQPKRKYFLDLCFEMIEMILVWVWWMSRMT